MLDLPFFMSLIAAGIVARRRAPPSASSRCGSRGVFHARQLRADRVHAAALYRLDAIGGASGIVASSRRAGSTHG